MRRLAFLLMLCASFAIAANEKADLALRHGRIYTMDAPRSWAESIAISKGRILYVGSDNGIDAFIGPTTQTIELGGRMVLPSFIDAHVHPVTAGVDLSLIDLSEVEKKDDILAAIKNYADSHPNEKWLLGGNWQLPAFPNANPQKEWLDAIVPDRPVMLDSADGHSCWVNSKALQLGGVTKDTKDPVGGRIERNAAGEPSGTLREGAKGLVSHLAPTTTPEQKLNGLQEALKQMNGFGITGFQEADARSSILSVYQEAAKRGILTARVSAAIYASPLGNITGSSDDDAEDKTSTDADKRLKRVLDQLEAIKKWRDEFHSEDFKADSIKIFEDGVIEPGTAAMLKPYVGMNGNTGMLLWPPEILNPFVQKADQANFKLHFHAIGDNAVRTALNALEAARKANGPRDARPVIAHLQVIDPADIPRFAQIGVIPCFQPLWAYEDTYITDLTLPKLEKDVWRWIYPIRSVADTGATMAMGSDWDVSTENPLEGIEVAVTRKAPGEPNGKDSFIPEERIELRTALAAYTIGSAYANFWEKETGSLETGKSADLIVLSDNLFTVAPDKISDAKVLLTLFKGKSVYRDESWK